MYQMDHRLKQFLDELFLSHYQSVVQVDYSIYAKKNNNHSSHFEIYLLTNNLTVLGCDGSFSPITHKPVILTAPLNGILNNNSGSSSLSTTFSSSIEKKTKELQENQFIRMLLTTFDRSRRSSQARKTSFPDPSCFSLKHCKLYVSIFVYKFHCPTLFSSTCWQLREHECCIFFNLKENVYIDLVLSTYVFIEQQE